MPGGPDARVDLPQFPVGDFLDQFQRQRPEPDDVLPAIEPVEELWPEGAFQIAHRLFHRRGKLEVCVEEMRLTDVGGHQDERVREADGQPAIVGQPSVVQHLEEDVEDVRMRLLDLVEEDDGMRIAAHGVGEDAACLIAFVARRRADQLGQRVLLHVFRHVETQHRLFVILQRHGQRLGDLGLADTGRAAEHERPLRLVRFLQPRIGHQHRADQFLDRMVLAVDPRLQRLIERQELFAFVLVQLLGGDAGNRRELQRDGGCAQRETGVHLFLQGVEGPLVVGDGGRGLPDLLQDAVFLARAEARAPGKTGREGGRGLRRGSLGAFLLPFSGQLLFKGQQQLLSAALRVAQGGQPVGLCRPVGLGGRQHPLQLVALADDVGRASGVRQCLDLRQRGAKAGQVRRSAVHRLPVGRERPVDQVERAFRLGAR
ncbi:200 kDa antigen p200, putative [Sagittula stellata E-37]|uniref:200 kDa antigen p200, putative n=1 Tax=Sagittula stellata (strain ATCC 700073 / DSM 11524 / E-37) TaxID=388399 RepID=A3K6L6_SAGS3|nr:200 kDa antigen p200, putative [Sagittula stellata E-37]